MIVALIVAAGSGERLGAGRPKALVELAGRPLLQWSIDALQQVVGIELIVVAMPPGAYPAPGLESVDGVQFVDGGASRSLPHGSGAGKRTSYWSTTPLVRW